MSEPLAAGSAVAAASPPVFSGAVVAAGSLVAVALLLLLFDPQPVRDKDRAIIITNDNENNLFLIVLSPFRNIVSVYMDIITRFYDLRNVLNYYLLSLFVFFLGL
ncbi:hypothetical protein D3C73_1328700 [compost metagenome]